MNKLTPYDILNFGKNKGLSLAEVYKYQPSYIEWAILKIEGFVIDIDSFYNLPNPTPVNYKPGHFDRNPPSIDESGNVDISEAIDLLVNTDSINSRINVNQIKSTEELQISEVHNFRFPESIVIRNEEKFKNAGRI